jgi:hypothetical protein
MTSWLRTVVRILDEPREVRGCGRCCGSAARQRRHHREPIFVIESDAGEFVGRTAITGLVHRVDHSRGQP